MARARRGRAASNPLWAYSLRLYRKPGVAPACIALQDRCGVDVNVLLFCLWMGACGRGVAPAAMRLAVGVSREWTAHVVAPLRQTRRFLKPLGVPAFRRAVARVELAAERLEQDMLVRLAPRAGRAPLRPSLAAARQAAANIARYSTYWRRAPRAADISDLLRILSAGFPGAGADELRPGLR